MESTNATEFGGVAGFVAGRAISWANAVNGFVFVVALLVVGFVFGMMGAPVIGQIAMQVVVAAFLARFGLNGMHGQPAGTVFSSRGGGAGEVLPVAGRYLALTAVWLLPVAALGGMSGGTSGSTSTASMMGAGSAPASPSMMMPGVGAAVTGFAVYALLSTLTPPVFLIVALTATSIGDVVSPEHWRAQFAGRGRDLFMVYVAYTGVLGMTLLCGVPVLVAIAGIGWKPAALVAIVVGVFVAGVVVDLLGRLSGFFAVGDLDGVPTATRSAAPPPDMAPADGDGDVGGPAPDTGPPDRAVLLAVAPADSATGGKPPLADATAHVQQAKRRFADDPEGAIATLEDLRAQHAPHPQVLYTLWSFQVHAGRTETALETARDAVPVLLSRGNAPLAAAMLKAHWDDRARLPFERAGLIAVASALTAGDDLAYAAHTYAMVLASDKRDPRAIKGILGIAERFHRDLDKPEDAARLYEFLLRTAPESPLVEYMQRGLDEARQKVVDAEAV